ncbi:ATP-binding protein [Streptomyces sp. HNM0574]|uniref:sensor histidine kinase n=1 Tax=Streptomyces sp. HNM0574 TaxID=2714954 RepID=UPI00146C8192|nr:ATP-binding protein [Streptomyces sp. HNM0574]NLU68900.1 ATP-binding protein [Streptomyces sp. HNM0574]
MTPVTTPSQQLPPPEGGVRRPPSRSTGTALALLGSVLVTGPAWLLVVYSTEPTDSAAPAWTAGVAALLLTAAVTVAAYFHFTARDLRARVAAKDGEIAAGHARNARLADEIAPAVVERLRAGAAAKTALADAPPVEDPAHARLLNALATEVHRGEGLRAAAMAACANAAGRVQALATSMAADLRDMQHRHQGEDILGDLLHLDHRTAQAGRMADSIAVLTGARSGRRWAKPIGMESILRGAMGRISGYQRIRLHSSTEIAVAGHAAEGVMHALAELMDNAANFSPPTSEVHVYVEEVAAGVVVTVEDGGLVMGEVALRRAQQAVSVESGDLSTLSGTRLGLPVVGRLARKHGLAVSFRPSAHGGTGVLMMIPQELVTEVKRENPAAPAAAAQVPAQGQAQAQTPARPRTRPQDPREHTRTESARTEPTRTEPARTEPAAPEPTRPAPEAPRPEPARGEPTRGGEAAQPLPAERQSGQNAAGASPDEDTVRIEYGESGLPKRRRGQTLAAARDGRAAARESAQRPAPRRSAQQSGSRFGAFRSAVQGTSSPTADSTSTGAADQTSGAPGHQDDGHPEAAGPTNPSPTPPSRPENETE